MNASTTPAMTIQLTPAAAERIRAQLAQRGQGLGLRLGVRKTGCSGWAYAVDFADQIGAEDAVFDQDGVRVVVGQADLPLLAGTVVDFVREGLNSAFRFQNPNVKGECGCGESFTV
jgi:iron-sulfur cluster assembly protein